MNGEMRNDTAGRGLPVAGKPMQESPDVVNAPKNKEGSGRFKKIVNLLRATSRIFPLERKSSTRNGSVDAESGSQMETLLEKFTVPPESEENPSAARRFTFCQGIPIAGSDEDAFTLKVSHRFIFNPEGKPLFIWLGLVTLAWVYSAWSLIARQAFSELKNTIPLGWVIMDYSCDFIYVLDIFVSTRTGYLESGLLVFDSKRLAKHYFYSKYFVLDVLCLLPLDLLYFTIGAFEPLIRFPRFLKLYRAKQFYRKAEGMTSYPNALRVIILSHTLMLTMHWFACFYYMISESENFHLPAGKTRGWAYPLQLGKNDSEWYTLKRKYLHSIYWSCLTLTTIGEKQSPSTDMEYICTLAAYFLGIFLFATVVGQVGSVISKKNASRQEFEKMVDNAKTFMKSKGVPKSLCRRVLRWYDYSWSVGALDGTADVNSLGMLPDTIKVELAIHVNLTSLRKVSIFRLAQPEFLYHLVLKMKTYIFTPGDMICRQGEAARQLYIISNGILEVVSDSGTMLARLKTGDFFGEIGVLDLMGGVRKRVANVRSVGYSEIFTISAEDVEQAMEYYPEAKQLLQTFGRQRLKESSNRPESVSEAKRVTSFTNLQAFAKGKASEDPKATVALKAAKKWRSIRKPLKNEKQKKSTSSGSRKGSQDVTIEKHQSEETQPTTRQQRPTSSGQSEFKQTTDVSNRSTQENVSVFLRNVEGLVRRFVEEETDRMVPKSEEGEVILQLREELRAKNQEISILQDDVKLLVDKISTAATSYDHPRESKSYSETLNKNNSSKNLLISKRTYSVDSGLGSNSSILSRRKKNIIPASVMEDSIAETSDDATEHQDDVTDTP
ncbi:cyclic nucleotide-gated channel alpha-3-like [Ciona intestinalis]